MSVQKSILFPESRKALFLATNTRNPFLRNLRATQSLYSSPISKIKKLSSLSSTWNDKVEFEFYRMSRSVPNSLTAIFSLEYNRMEKV